MKKNSKLSAPFILIGMILLFTTVSFSVEGKSIKKFIGTWTQCDKDGHIVALNQNNVREYKIITPDQFLVYQSNGTMAQMIFSGTIRIDKDILSETLLVSTPSMVSENGKVNSFRFRFEKGLLFIEGTNNKYKQIWKKVNPFQ